MPDNAELLIDEKAMEAHDLLQGAVKQVWVRPLQLLQVRHEPLSPLQRLILRLL